MQENITRSPGLSTQRLLERVVKLTSPGKSDRTDLGGEDKQEAAPAEQRGMGFTELPKYRKAAARKLGLAVVHSDGSVEEI
jgi:hypothetical protein